MKKAIVIFVVVFFSASLTSFSQGVADKISVEDFNPALLDSLIFNEVVTQRKKVDLPGLFISDAMRDSARVHSTQMLESGKLFYKTYRKGQCPIALDFEVRAYSYLELSRLIVNRWILSPGHKELVLGPLFIYGATSTQIKMEDCRLILKGIFYVSYEP